ncbi:MAG: ABC transporter ATP-binding protein [Actinobacteria bacterium]|nr:ABC transporter ATP-binding protein [Actinomycetota bacterium]
MIDDGAVRVDGLVVEHHTASGPLRALDRVALTVGSGTLVGVMGPSGCGKSTLLGVLAGLATPTSGTVTIGSTEITSLSEPDRTAFRKDAIGVVYQVDNLLPFLTVAENVRLQLALCGDDDDAQRRTDDLLERLGLGALGGRLPDELSGGQRQRAAVARAIVHRPALILADEPTGALDESNARAVIALLADAHRDLGATVVIVTHDPSVAESMQRVLTLRDGALVDDSEAGA